MHVDYVLKAKEIYSFLKLAEKLKCELRHSWLSSGRRESVAEHCWQMSLFAMLVAPNLEKKVDVSKAIRMIIIHDLVEAITGDVPFTDKSERSKNKKIAEAQAIKDIRGLIDGEISKEIYDLFHEYECNETAEAKFVKALDNLEVQAQHNYAGAETWEKVEYALVYTKMDRHCKHDIMLKSLCDIIKQDAETEMDKVGVDYKSVRKKLAA